MASCEGREKMLQPDDRKPWDPGGEARLSPALRRLVISAMDDKVKQPGGQHTGSRTELDSHANMSVVGKEVYILADTGKTVDVKAFSPDYDTRQVPLVDAAIQYDCPFSGKSVILVIQNALHVPARTICCHRSWFGRLSSKSVTHPRSTRSLRRSKII